MGYNVEYDDTGAEDYDYFDDLVHRPNRSRVSSSSPQAVPCDRGATNANVSSQVFPGVVQMLRCF